MKLLKAIRNLDLNSKDKLPPILKAIEKRITWLEIREPESCGTVYENWNETLEELEEIKELIVKAIQESELLQFENLIEEIQNDIETYQIIHGGLSRLRIGE